VVVVLVVDAVVVVAEEEEESGFVEDASDVLEFAIGLTVVEFIEVKTFFESDDKVDA
jgi:hypothetical protein